MAINQMMVETADFSKCLYLMFLKCFLIRVFKFLIVCPIYILSQSLQSICYTPNLFSTGILSLVFEGIKFLTENLFVGTKVILYGLNTLICRDMVENGGACP